ncbi:MAG TPA: hypothetical protein VIN34_11455 [Candidatus Limnocylindria bacterium]
MTADGNAGSGMAWDPNAEAALATLARMVPETLRTLAAAAARDESEAVASDRDAATVAPDDVIRGWIRTTPPEQRNGLVAIIDDLGFDVELFAEDLQSDGDWPEDEGS